VPGWLNIGGSAIYLLVVIAACLAWRAAQLAERPSAEARLWLVASGFFLGCALSRLLMLESSVRHWGKSIFLESFAYGDRASFQATLAALAVLGFATLIVFTFRRNEDPASRQHRQSLLVAKLAMLGMVGLIALRLVSYHPIDSLLYRGLHLNWALDIGLSVAVGWAAWRYISSIR